jgi:hypothetical protein
VSSEKKPPSDAADYRRGHALLLHGLRGDDEGIATVVEEAAEATRLDYLALAPIAIMWQWADQLGTPAEVAVFEEFVAKAAADDPDPAGRLAWRLVLAHRAADKPAIAAVLGGAAAMSGGLAEFAVTCAATVTFVMPEMRTEHGMRDLESNLAQIAAAEGGHPR